MPHRGAAPSDPFAPARVERVVRLRHVLVRPVWLALGAGLWWALYRWPLVFPGPSILHVTVFFVAAAGYTLGFLSGLVAGLAGLVLHAIVLRDAGVDGVGAMFAYAPASHLATALVGALTGRLRSLERRARREAARRLAREAQLHANETHYRTIVERMHDAVIECANDGTILYANEQLCRMTGYALDELVGADANRLLLVEGCRDLVTERIRERLAGRASSYRMPIRRRDGGHVWCQVSGAPIVDDEGHVIGRVATLIDVSEQVRAEQRLEAERRALRESETRFRELVENIDGIFWIKSAHDGRMLYVSPGFERIVGRPRTAVYADPTALLEWVHPADRERVVRALDHTGPDHYTVDYRIVRPDGTVRWLHARGFPVRGEGPTPARVAGVTTDVTALRHAEALARSRGAVLAEVAAGSRLETVLHTACRVLTRSVVGAVVVALDVAGTVRACASDANADADGAGDETTGEALEGTGPPADAGPGAPAGLDVDAALGVLAPALRRESPNPVVVPDAAAASPVDAAVDTSSLARAGVRACWIQPVRSSDGAEGAFVLLFTTPRSPDEGELEIVRTVAEIAGIATRRQRDRESLEQREQVLRLFVEHSPAAIAMFDRRMRCLAASRRWVEDHGAASALAPPAAAGDDAAPPWRTAHVACLRDRRSRRGEDLVELRDGRNEWVRWQVHPWRDAEGAVGGVTVWTEIVTGERQAREQLARSEERYRFLVDHLPDTLTEIDREGRILFVSRDYPRRTRDETVGATIDVMLAEADRARARDILDACAADRRVRSFTVEHPCDGTVWTHRVVPIVEDGLVVRFLVISTDVTTRHRTERALAESNARYRRFFEHDLSAAFIARPDGTLDDCNPAFLRLFGLPDPAAARRAGLSALAAEPGQVEALVAHVRDAGRIEQHRVTLRTLRGETVHVIANLVGEFDEGGTLVHVHGYLVDDTARRTLEEQLHQAQKMEAIGRLAGGVAHDFNNMLTTIAGYTELLRDRLADDESLRHYCDEVMLASDRAADLTRRLLEFSRRRVLQPQPVPINRVVDDMRDMIARTIGEHIDLVVETDAGAGRVEAAPGTIETILLNLTLNARDAMPRGGRLTVRTEVVEADADPALDGDRWVRLSVTDTGIGMDEEIRQRIFEPFFTTKEQGEGTGLGLATVYGAVRQCGGHIRVSSAPGRGTTFAIYFEMLDALPEGVGEGHERVRVLGPTRGSETVLVAEDEEAVRRLMHDVLESRGYRVLIAGDGDEALHIARHFEGEIDLLVTDLVMPEINGRELARAVRERRPSVRVLYISGYIGRASIRVAELGPRTSFLSKPFSPQSFARKVRLLLDIDRRRPSLADIARRSVRAR